MNTITAPKQKEIDYYDRPEISHSKLRKLKVSYNEYLKPFGKPTKDMLLGTALHEAVLEPEVFATRKESTVKGVNTKKYEEETKEQGFVIPQGETDKILKARDIILSHPQYHLLDGNKEVEIYETLNGYECKGKMDSLNLDKERVTDLKSYGRGLESIKPYWWIRDKLYHTQLAFYGQLAGKKFGMKIKSHILFVYSWSNEDVRVFQLSEETLSEADRIIDGWFDKLTNVEIDGAFKGMSAEIEII